MWWRHLLDKVFIQKFCTKILARGAVDIIYKTILPFSVNIFYVNEYILFLALFFHLLIRSNFLRRLHSIFWWVVNNCMLVYFSRHYFIALYSRPICAFKRFCYSPVSDVDVVSLSPFS